MDLSSTETYLAVLVAVIVIWFFLIPMLHKTPQGPPNPPTQGRTVTPADAPTQPSA